MIHATPTCTPDYPCLIPGTGFRVVADTGAQCRIDDAPMEGKMPYVSGYDPLESLRFDSGTTHSAPAETVHIAPVPLPASLELMGGVMVVLALFWFLPKCVAGMESVKGISGWP